jgi:SAM-dependent methyltransferase
MEGFDEFCINEKYVSLKNSLFNYINRKKSIRCFFNQKLQKYNYCLMVDVGCGLSPVTPRPDETLFIDISKEALQYLNNKGYKTKYGNIGKEIPLESYCADIIFCSEVLEHVDDYYKSLQEIYRVLKGNGKLILTLPVYQKYWGFDDEYVRHYRRFEPGTIKLELQNIGFKVLDEIPIGSWAERKMTMLVVKIFKDQKDKTEYGKLTICLARTVNYLMFLIVRFSLLFTSKKTTSIMLYYCEK